MTKRFLLTLACSAAMLTVPAFAQDFLTPQNPDSAAIPAWPMTVPTNQIIVVTLAEPGVRHRCTLGSLTPEALTCVGAHGGKPTVYKPAQVEALINPRYHEHYWIPVLSFLGAGGAIIYAATLLNPFTTVGAVIVGIFGGMIAGTAGAFAIGANGDLPDRLLYLAPDHKLSVTLRK